MFLEEVCEELPFLVAWFFVLFFLIVAHSQPLESERLSNFVKITSVRAWNFLGEGLGIPTFLFFTFYTKQARRNNTGLKLQKKLIGRTDTHKKSR